eukprot:XP_002262472.1 hypothetical protein, conserved in Plasmodium species [Plasmodium knowlesi strain H]
MAGRSPPLKKKKLRGSEEAHFIGRRQNEANSMETNILVTQNKEKGELEKYTCGKVWLYSKINNLYARFNMLKMSIQRGDHREEKGKVTTITKMSRKRGDAQRYIHEQKNVKKKKRTFSDISNENNVDTEKTEGRNHPMMFQHLEILKSLLSIYQFYRTDDSSGDMGLPPGGGTHVAAVYKVTVPREEKTGAENDKIQNGSIKNGLIQKYNFQENEKYNKSLSDIFSSIVNDKCGFFFIFNAIFFTNLKNFYYFVDIINVLNCLGNGRSFTKGGRPIEKDILIYEQIASFVENCYCCFVDEVDNGCNCFSFDQGYPSGNSTKLMHTRKINTDKVEKIKNKLKELKREKSNEELLFLSMNECNKKIFQQFSKIPDLFSDMTEISEYSRSDPSKGKYSLSDYAPTEILHAQSNNDLSRSSLERKNTILLYNQSDYAKAGTYEDSRSGSLHILKNSLSIMSESHPSGEDFQENNSHSPAKRDTVPKGEMPFVGDYPNEQSNKLINSNEHTKKGYIKNFFLNLFKNGQTDKHTEGSALPAADERNISPEGELPKLNLNDKIPDGINGNDTERDNERDMSEINHLLPIGEPEEGIPHVESNTGGAWENHPERDEEKSDEAESSESISDEGEAQQSDDRHLKGGCSTVKEPSEVASPSEHSGEQRWASSSLSMSSAEEEQSKSESANSELEEVEPLSDDKREEDPKTCPGMTEERDIQQNDGKENNHQLCVGDNGEGATEESSPEEIPLLPSQTEVNQVNKTENHNDEEVEEVEEAEEAALGGDSQEEDPLECNEMEENTIKGKAMDDGEKEFHKFKEEESKPEIFSQCLEQSGEVHKCQGENDNKLVDIAESEISAGQMQNGGGANEGDQSNCSNPNGEDEISAQNGVGFITITGEGEGTIVVAGQGEQVVDSSDKLDECKSEHDDAEKECACESDKVEDPSKEGEDASSEGEASSKGKFSSKEEEKEEQGLDEPPQKIERTEEGQNGNLNGQVSQSEKEDNANTPEGGHSILSDDDSDDSDNGDSEEDDEKEEDVENEEEEDEYNDDDENDEHEDDEEEEEEEDEDDDDNDDDQIVHFLKSSNRGNPDGGWYAEYLRNMLRCDKKCTVENHAEEKDLFLSKVKKLSNLVKYKKFKEKYTKKWEEKIALFKCNKLRRAYKIFLVIVFSIVKEIKELKKELKDMSQFVFINSGIENYLNENNMSTVRKNKESGVGANRFDDYHLGSANLISGSDNVINSFFLMRTFQSEDSEKDFNGKKKKKKKYISYVPLENYHILFQSIEEIFNEKNVQEKLANISYYIELDKYIPHYCSLFFRQFKIKKQLLSHIQSLYNNSVPTVECVNMFIACLNNNYSNILKKKFVFQCELNNSYLAKLPCVYCCDVQIVRHVDFLKLKETCQRIIKQKKIHQLFVDHLSSSLLDESYFIVPFFTSYGKFLIVIKSSRSDNPEYSSMDILQNKNLLTYDILINSFVFPNGSSFQAIVHLSYVFINTLRDFFKTRNSDENIPEIAFLSLPHLDKQKLLHHEMESSTNRADIIVSVPIQIMKFLLGFIPYKCTHVHHPNTCVVYHRCRHLIVFLASQLYHLSFARRIIHTPHIPFLSCTHFI